MNSLAKLQLMEERLSKIEKQNRILKRISLIPLLCLTAILSMGQVRPTRLIEAESIVIKDTSGKERIRLGLVGNRPQVSLIDASGDVTELNSGSLIVFGSGDKVKLWLSSGPKGSALTLSDPSGKAEAVLAATDDGSKVELNDREGYMAVVGSAQLVKPRTGETSKTSAASISLFDKNSNVIWRAP